MRRDREDDPPPYRYMKPSAGLRAQDAPNLREDKESVGMLLLKERRNMKKPRWYRSGVDNIIVDLLPGAICASGRSYIWETYESACRCVSMVSDQMTVYQYNRLVTP